MVAVSLGLSPLYTLVVKRSSVRVAGEKFSMNLRPLCSSVVRKKTAARNS